MDSTITRTALVRPASDAGPTQIKVRYLIIAVRELDSAKQTFEADVFWRLRWNDPRLSLPETNAPVRVLPLASIWNPRLDLWNSSSAKTTYNDVVEVDALGNVVLRQRTTGTFDAQFDFRAFPFDSQTLVVRALAARDEPADVVFVSDDDASGVAPDTTIPEWKLQSDRLDTAPMTVGTMDSVRASFAIVLPVQRDSAYYVGKMLVPLFLIIAMAYVVLWIDPTQFGPQIGVCTGAIFSFIAFRFSLSLSLPKISYLTRMDEFVFGATLLVFLPLGKAIVTSRLVKSERSDWVSRLDVFSRWVYPVCVALLAWLTLRG